MSWVLFIGGILVMVGAVGGLLVTLRPGFQRIPTPLGKAVAVTIWAVMAVVWIGLLLSLLSGCATVPAPWHDRLEDERDRQA